MLKLTLITLLTSSIHSSMVCIPPPPLLASPGHSPCFGLFIKCLPLLSFLLHHIHKHTHTHTHKYLSPPPKILFHHRHPAQTPHPLVPPKPHRHPNPNHATTTVISPYLTPPNLLWLKTISSHLRFWWPPPPPAPPSAHLPPSVNPRHCHNILLLPIKRKPHPKHQAHTHTHTLSSRH